MIDWEQERKSFPATKDRAYFMNAATSLFHDSVYQAYRDEIDWVYEKGERNWINQSQLIADTRQAAADLLEASPADIAFSPNSSHGVNLIALMIKQSASRNTIVVPEDAFPTSSFPFIHHGFNLKRVPSIQSELSVERILDAVDDDTAAVICSVVQFRTGYRVRINQLGEELKKRNVLFIVNSTQALGAFPVSVRDSKADALVSSGHKWLGAGYGASLFYTREAFRHARKLPLAGWTSLIDPMAFTLDSQDLRPESAGIETGTLPYATLAGVNAACRQVLRLGAENIAGRILELSSYFVDEVRKLNIPLVSFRDEELDYRTSCNSGIVSLDVDDANGLEQVLSSKNIFVNARAGSIRVAIHYYNNHEDIDRLLLVLEEELSNA